MRLSEITNLRWRAVDLQRKLISVESNATFKTKHGKKRDIPLNDAVVYLLGPKAQPEGAKGTDDYVFTLNNNKILDTWLSHKFKYYVYECRFQEDRLLGGIIGGGKINARTLRFRHLYVGTAGFEPVSTCRDAPRHTQEIHCQASDPIARKTM